jgi:predicted RNA-binding protein YlqC (UPF0109 family)
LRRGVDLFSGGGTRGCRSASRAILFQINDLFGCGAYDRAMSSQAIEMRSLLLSIARTLVDDTEHLTIEADEAGGLITLRLRVSWLDMGKIIGKHGRTAQSLRVLLLGAAMKRGARCQLDIVEGVA